MKAWFLITEDDEKVFLYPPDKTDNEDDIVLEGYFLSYNDLMNFVINILNEYEGGAPVTMSGIEDIIENLPPEDIGGSDML